MIAIALKMLFGDSVKLVGLVLGVAFSSLLMAQQGGFFISLISRSASIVSEARGVDIWVMNPKTETVEGATALRDVELYRVRGVDGVRRATPLSIATITFRTNEGRSSAAALLGVDDVSLLGINPAFSAGSTDALRQPEGIVMDRLGFSKLWPNEPTSLGKQVEINEKRARVLGLSSALPGFTAPVIVYARYGQAADYAPTGRNRLSFVLVEVEQGRDPGSVARAIQAQTGLVALTSAQLQSRSIDYVLRNTGIAPSFGVVIALGAVVGILVTGLTFTLFVNDNIRQFAVLKAMGLSNLRLLGMVMIQAILVAGVGFSIGLWVAASFFEAVNQPLSDLVGFRLPWQVAALTGLATLSIVVLASILATRRVLRLDPATVFRS